MSHGLRTRWRGLAVLLMGISAWGCEDLGPAGPRGPGVLAVDLLSPAGSEGSAVFEIRGGTGLGAVTTPDGEVYYRHGTEVGHVVVILDAPGPIRFHLESQDVRDLPQVTVLQVADGEDRLRTSLAGYAVEIFPWDDGGPP